MSRNGGVNWASNVCVFTWNGGVMWCECPSACVLVERSGRQHLGYLVALNLKTTNVMLFLPNESSLCPSRTQGQGGVTALCSALGSTLSKAVCNAE